MSSRPVLDQVAHASAAAIFLFPAALWPNPLTFALAGASIGFVRELTEVGPLVTPEALSKALADAPSRLDVFFWALGGFLAGLGTL